MLTDIERIGFETVCHMQIAYMSAVDGHRKSAVANVLELEAPKVADAIHSAAPMVPYNTCLALAIESCARLFERTIVGDR